MENIQIFEFDFVINIAYILRIISSPRQKNGAGSGESTGNMLINNNITTNN